MQKQFYPVIGTEKALPFYIIGIGVSCWQFPVSRPEGYDYPQLFVCLEGEGEVTVDGKTVKIMPDSTVPTNIEPRLIHGILTGCALTANRLSNC